MISNTILHGKILHLINELNKYDFPWKSFQIDADWIAA